MVILSRTNQAIRQYIRFGGIMKSLTKHIGRTIVAFAAILSLVFGIGAGINLNDAYAASDEDYTYKHFYGRLSPDTRAEKFYAAYEKLAESGEFKKGAIEYDVLSNGFTDAADVSAYINGTDNKIIKAFGAGRDAFIMDHPDLFYVDLFGTSLSMGMQKNSCAAYLDSSRVLTLYSGSINTEKAVNAAIAKYEAKLDEIVAAAKAAGTQPKEQIEFVNKYICDNTVYSFGTEIKDGRNVDTPAAAYISTAYGSLVNGQAICGGYAKGFKAVMDRLGIPCVCVQGYSKRNGNMEPHMWNYVELDGMWYAVDVTFNDTGSNLQKVLLVGGEALKDTHIEDNVISSSGYELRYPAVKPYDYGDDVDDNGMTIVGEYKESSDNTGKTLELFVSFDDKNAKTLKEEGKIFIFRSGDFNAETNSVKWTAWFDAKEFGEVYVPLFLEKENGEQCVLHAGIEYIQFALTSKTPDENFQAFYPTDKPDIYGDLSGKPHYYGYKEETCTEDGFFIGEPSVPYHNNAFGSYLPAPGASSVSPHNGGSLPVDDTYDVRIVYNTELELADNGKPAGMDFTTSRGNDTVKQNAVLTDFNWDGEKTITFKFTPSKMFIHNNASYYFVPTNLVGVKSKKAPDFVYYSFKRKSVVCSKIFNDGRLYMNVFGDPRMLDSSDLSVTDFKDENGNYYAASQRSQLMLVASKPTKATQQEMDEALKNNVPIKDGEIITSASYEINLQICGVVQKVPNGSYMQVAFGFPEGYDANDAGTTFKIYHYTHDDKGNITGVEEIPAIITEYGLIAKVKSFSPFTVVQVKNTSAAVGENKSKNIYAYVNGIGGTVTSNGTSGIAQVGDSITYEIRADKGYSVGTVRLNGKTVDASRYSKGTLVLTSDEIESSNMLEVSFITTQSLKSYAAKGISLVIDGTSVVMPKTTNVVGIVLGCIFAVVALAAGGFTLWWFVFRKRPIAKAAATGSATVARSSAKASPTSTRIQNTAPKPSVSAKPTARPTTTATTRPSATSSTARPSGTRPSQTAKPTSTSAARPSAARTVSQTRPSSAKTAAATRPSVKPSDKNKK